MDQHERDNEQLGLILKYCSRLEESVSFFGNSYKEFASTIPFQDSCSLCLIQIGEAVNRISDGFKNDYPQIEWGKIYGMRNHLVHGYEMFDAEIAWDAIERFVPSLQEFCAERFVE